MRYWITPDGSYYEGLNVADGSIEVTKRPSQFHEWIDGEWLFSQSLKRQSLSPLSARQVRLILSQLGYRESVEAGVSQSSQSVKDEWNYANEFFRNSPVLNGMAQSLGLSDEQVDAMFEQGITL